MRVRVAEIKETELALEFIESAGDFPVLRTLMDRGECGFSLPVKARLRIRSLGEVIEVAGRVETCVEMACSRCLKPAAVSVESSFELVYTRGLPEIREEDDEEGYEITAEDLGLIRFDGEEIDFRDAIQEQVVLALPDHPLCNEQCRGLCAQCGADLNEDPCGCEPRNFNIKFAALRDLKLDN